MKKPLKSNTTTSASIVYEDPVEGRVELIGEMHIRITNEAVMLHGDPHKITKITREPDTDA